MLHRQAILIDAVFSSSSGKRGHFFVISPVRFYPNGIDENHIQFSFSLWDRHLPLEKVRVKKALSPRHGLPHSDFSPRKPRGVSYGGRH